MKLYRYELDSNNTDKDNIAGKKLISEFASANNALDYIRNHQTPQYKALAVVACHDDESLDEELWLLEFESNNGA